MKHIHIEHCTRYDYSHDVFLAQHLAHLKPLKTPWQEISNHTLTIWPPCDDRNDRTDAFGNAKTFFTLTTPHRELTVDSVSRVTKRDRYADFDPDKTLDWNQVRAQMAYGLEQPFVDASEFIWPSPFVPWLPELKDYTLPSFPRGRPVGSAAVELCQRIFNDFSYISGATEIHTPLAHAFANRHGVCQDFSHIMIGCLRSIGLAARYVSGYLLTTPPPGQPHLRGSDASHAWVSVYCPQAPGQWLELDPTNRTLADSSHVLVAQGRDFGDVSPLRGVIQGGGQHNLSIAVTAQLLNSG